MGKKRPERAMVEAALKEHPSKKAYEIAEEIGIIETMGYDASVQYVRQVRKAMKKSGEIQPTIYPTDEERLQDIEKLFELRAGKASRLMLILNCYYRLRSADNNIHGRAIDDTYEKNTALNKPYHMSEAIHLCEIALTQYMASIDGEKNATAQKHGYPNAGLNYTDKSFIAELEITEEELKHLNIKERVRP